MTQRWTTCGCILLLFTCFLFAACGTKPTDASRDSATSSTTEFTSPPTPSSVFESAVPTPAESTDSTTQTREESSPPVSVPETTTQVQEENKPLTTDFSHLQYGEEKITFRERKSNYEDFFVARRMRTVSVNGRKYCFDSYLPEAECTERVQFTEEILIRAGITKEFRICLYSINSVKYPYIKEGNLYGRISVMSDIDYLTAVLLAAYGEFANYGMAYGYAGLLLGEEATEAQYPLDWDYYDLNYLCFLSQYVSEEDIDNAEAVAMDFAHEYVARNGHEAYQELLEKSGRLEEAEEAREALLSHYKSHGAEPELSPLLYAMGGTTYSHIIQYELATFYIERDWAEYHQSSYGEIDDDSNDYLHDLVHCTTSYKAHRNVFESIRLEMVQLQDFFYLYPYRNTLSVFCVNNDKLSYGGLYIGDVHDIYLKEITCFAHEYIHSLTMSHITGNKWAVEGLATYFSLLFSNYDRASNEYYFRTAISKMTGIFKDMTQAWVYKQEGQLDIIDYYGLYAYWSGDTVSDDPYFIGAAFIEYLIKRFGEREMLDYFLVHHDLSQLTDKSMEELMEDWKLYLDARFKDYDKAGEAIDHTQNTPDYSNLEYEEEKITFSEQRNDFDYYIVTRRMRTVTVNGRKYCFELSLPEADCTERICFTEEILTKAGITKEFRIFLYSTVKNTYIEAGSLYGRMSAMSDMEYITAVLLSAYGEFANYGMAYGYAGLLLEEEIPEAEYPMSWDYYDLNYLCFHPRFSSEKDAENAKAIALDFAAEYVAQKGHAAYQTLLEESGKAEDVNAAREALINHYKTRGVSPVLSPVLYAMGGQTYDYLVRCEYAYIYMGKDCVVRQMEGGLYYPETYLHEDYPTVAYVFECLREEMHLYQSFLDLYPYNNELKVFFVKNIRKNDKGSLAGYYDGVKHQIHINHLFVFYEEYIHSITHRFLGKDPFIWQIEGIANYLVNKYARFYNEDYNEVLNPESHPELIEKPVGQYFKSLGRPYDSMLDWHDYSDWLTYFNDFYNLDKYCTYEGAHSFMTYLCRRFGEREVLDYLLDHHDLRRLTDESLEELMLAWKESIEERFKGYKKKDSQS